MLNVAMQPDGDRENVPYSVSDWATIGRQLELIPSVAVRVAFGK